MDKTVIRLDGDESVVIANDNTTIGYATLNASNRELTYIFVNPLFRRRGYGSVLVAAAEKLARCRLKPSDPVSPLGQKFFKVIN